MGLSHSQFPTTTREVDVTQLPSTFVKRRYEDDVFLEDWFIVLVGGFLGLKDLGRWDVAMCSQREKWLKGLSNVKIAGVDEYSHRNESVRWLISRRIRHVTKIVLGEILPNRNEIILSRTFSGARALVNLKSMVLDIYSKDSIMDSIKVNCPNLEELHIEYCTLGFEDIGMSSFAAAAARMVQKLPRLRCFTFTSDNCGWIDNSDEAVSIERSSTPLLLALAQYCPLLESLDLFKYNDEGLAELVAGCRKLHTLTINADTRGVSLAGFRALGRSRSITNLAIHTYAIDIAEDALRAMADEGMPIKTLELYNNRRYRDFAFFDSENLSALVPFAPTLENLTLRNLLHLRDEGLAVLRQCHNLRSIEIDNDEDGYDEEEAVNGPITGAFLNRLGVGCPSLEKVSVSDNRGDPDEAEVAEAINFTHFFERCPNLKHFDVDIRTDEEVKALVQHCPRVEYIKLGSSDGTIPQEQSEISDVSLVAIGRGLHFVKHISLYCTQCTDAGLRALVATGECCPALKDFRSYNGTWKEGYPQLITKKGKEELMAVLKIRNAVDV